jgi:flagellar M-ring protein FliF
MMDTAERQGTFWSRLTLPARIGLVAGVVLIGAGAIALGLWSSRTDYGVLFSQLNETDAASIVAELKKQKIPYRLTDGGATVEVPAASVYDTRLALFSSGLPLSGGVGFEIYDRQGYGLTEQDQRVEYQRALQGELAQTIDSLEGVKYARVQLVIPPQTIFKSDREPPSAAVSLVLVPGTRLTSAQVAGIQRMVAASVAGLRPAAVIVNDQRGITLSAVDPSGADGSGSNTRLAIQRDVENYLEHKIAALLDRAYGPGQALVSVDVALNFDQMRTTVQSLVPIRGAGAAGGAEGAVLRRQETETGGAGGGPSLAAGPLGTSEPKSANSTTDVEYEYGRRVEQIVAAPGNITRMSIGVIVPGALTQDKRQRIADLVSMAAGASAERGDEVDVQSLDALVARTPPSLGGERSAAAIKAPAALPHARTVLSHASAAPALRGRLPSLAWSAAGAGALIALALGGLLGVAWARGRRGRETTLSAAERRMLLAEVEQVLGAGGSAPARSGA